MNQKSVNKAEATPAQATAATPKPALQTVSAKALAPASGVATQAATATVSAKRPATRKAMAKRADAAKTVPAAKPAAKALPVATAAAADKPERTVKPALSRKAAAEKEAALKKDKKKAEKAAREEKPAKAKKTKLVRDSYAMPEAEYQQIGALKKRMAGLGGEVKKSELLRAGIALLASLDDAGLKVAVGRVERIKTGRPAK